MTSFLYKLISVFLKEATAEIQKPKASLFHGRRKTSKKKIVI
jgi:hypothetical protein